MVDSPRGIFAVLVNPRDGRLYTAVSAAQETGTYACDLAGRSVGNGYLETRVTSLDAASATATGLPRAHTTDGAVSVGQGLGTVLYTALCARAHVGATNALALPPRMPARGGDGISSETQTRTADADAWWQRARERFGLAREVRGCAQYPFAGIQSVPDRAARSALAAAFGVPDGSVNLKNFRFEAHGSYEQCGLTFDVYPYASAREAHLVAGVTEPRHEGRVRLADLDPTALAELDPGALAAVNVAALREALDDDAAARALAWLLATAEHAGVPAADRDRMRLRFRAGVDVAASGTGRALAARENPARLRVVRLAPSLRANPGRASASDAAVGAAARNLQALRGELGWDFFVDDVPPAPSRRQNRSRLHPPRRRP